MFFEEFEEESDDKEDYKFFGLLKSAFFSSLDIPNWVPPLFLFLLFGGLGWGFFFGFFEISPVLLKWFLFFLLIPEMGLFCLLLQVPIFGFSRILWSGFCWEGCHFSFYCSFLPYWDCCSLKGYTFEELRKEGEQWNQGFWWIIQTLDIILEVKELCLTKRIGKQWKAIILD